LITNETTVKTAIFKQLRKSDWYAGGIANFLSSSEQQIALRSTLGAALATRPVFTNRSNLTVVGRVRMTLNQDVYYKFLRDFYIRLSFYDNYDNKPVVVAPTNNLGGSTPLGWSFH
jgi:hypothetical protein